MRIKKESLVEINKICSLYKEKREVLDDIYDEKEEILQKEMKEKLKKESDDIRANFKLYNDKAKMEFSRFFYARFPEIEDYKMELLGLGGLHFSRFLVDGDWYKLWGYGGRMKDDGFINITKKTADKANRYNESKYMETLNFTPKDLTLFFKRFNRQDFMIRY